MSTPLCSSLQMSAHPSVTATLLREFHDLQSRMAVLLSYHHAILSKGVELGGDKLDDSFLSFRNSIFVAETMPFEIHLRKHFVKGASFGGQVKPLRTMNTHDLPLHTGAVQILSWVPPTGAVDWAWMHQSDTTQAFGWEMSYIIEFPVYGCLTSASRDYHFWNTPNPTPSPSQKRRNMLALRIFHGPTTCGTNQPNEPAQACHLCINLNMIC